MTERSESWPLCRNQEEEVEDTEAPEMLLSKLSEQRCRRERFERNFQGRDSLSCTKEEALVVAGEIRFSRNGR